MQNKINTLLQTSEVTSLAVALMENSAITATYSFGNDNPLQQVWRVESLTKPIFVYGVLRLAQEGILDLDEPLAHYLPQPYLADTTYVPEITARHAMTHSTGFPDRRDEHELQAKFAPGSRFSYSSEGLLYLQYVVEYLIEMPLKDYMRDYVFLPLGMHETELGTEDDHNLPSSFRINGAMSLCTTVNDYSLFIKAIFEQSQLGETWLNEMLTPQIRVGEIDNLFWGLGWGLQSSRDVLSFWHWGTRSASHSRHFALGIPSEKRAIVIFTNHPNGLYTCQDVVEAYMGLEALPAFDWLLPVDEWRPDGRNNATAGTR